MMTNYILNCISSEESKENFFLQCLENRNYAFMPFYVSNDFAFYSFCKFDCLKAVKICMSSQKPDINASINECNSIFIIFFL